jgi:iron complex outermembrane receptor protein
MNGKSTSWRVEALAALLACGSGLAPAPAGAAPPSADPDGLAELSIEELMKVQTSPFEVSADLDDRYRASNSVSGSRFDAPIVELPFVIQAFTQEFIDDQRPVNVFDVARYSPGVTYRSNDFNEGNANVAIRGFAVSSTPGSVQILRDGFHGPSILDFTNVARVEVVKGPASFLYGQVAPGGIVNVITKSPQREFAAVTRARYGSYGQYRVEPDVTGPLVKEKLFYRLAASYDQDIRYWDLYDAHSWNVSPSLVARPSERLSISLKYEHFGKTETPQVMQKPGYGTQSGVVPTASDPNLSGVDVPGLPDTWNSMSHRDFRHSHSNALNMWVDLKAGDHWDLRTAYSHLDYTVDALFSGNFGMANNSTFLQGRRFRRQTYSNSGNTAELQALGKYLFEPVSVRLLVGAQYVSRAFEAMAASAPNDPALGSDPTASPLPLWDLRDSSTWNREVNIPLSAITEGRVSSAYIFADRALYGGATMGFFDERLLMLVGLRQTWTDVTYTNRIVQTSDATITASKITPQYGALFKLTNGASLFGSYAESFVPSSGRLALRNVATVPAAPTKGKGFDAGLKFDLLDRRISGTITYFDISNEDIVNDLAELDPATGALLLTNVQSGQQRSQGVELDAAISPARAWQIYVSYSYMDARIVEFSGNDAAILARDPASLDAAGQANYKNVRRFHGAPLQMSAPQMANLWTRYDFEEGDLAGFYLAGGANIVHDQTILPDTPKSAHQSYALLSAMIGYAWELQGCTINLDVMGKNLADQRYRPSQSTRSRPRELLLSSSLKF